MKIITRILVLVFFVQIYSRGNAQSCNWVMAEKGIGGNGDWGGSIATDPMGNIIVTGVFQSPQIILGTDTLFNSGGRNIFVAKYTPSGNVLWAKSARGQAEGPHVTVDRTGNILLTGFFYSSNIIFGSDTLLRSGPNDDIFIIKYNSSGNVLWAKREGGTGSDRGRGIATDQDQNIYVCGNFASASISFGTTVLQNTASYDVFLVKYDPAGNALWAKSAGGDQYDLGDAVAMDGSGPVITGSFTSPIMLFDTMSLTRSGANFNIFLAKYDNNGNVVWVRGVNGTTNGWEGCVAADQSGNIFLSGGFDIPTITFDTITLTNSGMSNMFIVKYSSAGNVEWAKKAVSCGSWGNGITTDINGNVLVTGHYGSCPIISFGNITLAGIAGFDIFVVSYGTNGNVLWAKNAGGNDSDVGSGIASFGGGNAFVTGFFSSSPANFNTISLLNTNSAYQEFFVAGLKYDNTALGVSPYGVKGIASMSPNPSHGLFTLSGMSENFEIKIYNSLGALVFSAISKENGMLIDLSEKPKGIYFVDMINGGKRNTQKMIIE